MCLLVKLEVPKYLSTGVHTQLEIPSVSHTVHGHNCEDAA